MSQTLQLVVRIRADGTAEVVGAARQVAAGVGGIDAAARQAGAGARTLTAELGQVRTALVGLGATAAAIKVVQWADDWTRAAGRLSLVSKNTVELAANQQKLFALAQETRSAFEGTVDLYARMSRSSRELGLAQGEVLRITETVNKAVKISGGAATSAAAGVFQFSQALASGQLRGEELNSVLEQTPRLAEAIAAGLGVPIGKLRQLAEAGELTANKVTSALRSQVAVIDAEFAKLPVTVADAYQRMENAAKRWIGQNDAALGGTRALAGGMGLLAENFGTVADAAVTAAGVVGAVYAGRAVAAAVTGTRELVAAQTLARFTVDAYSGAVTRQTVAMQVGAGAARVFGTALAAFGGPIGLAITALAVGLGYLATRQVDAAEAASEHRSKLEDLDRRVAESTELSREAAQAKLAEAIAERESTKAKLENARAELERRRVELLATRGAPTGAAAQDLLAAQRGPAKQIAELKKQDELIASLQARLDSIANGFKLTGALADFDKLKSKLEETLATLGKTEAEALRYRLTQEAMAKEGVKSANQLNGATKAQIDQLVAVQENIDAKKTSIEGVEQAEKDWAEVIEAVAKLERERAKELRDSEQAIADQVAAIGEEARQLGLSAAERDYAVERMRAEAVARKANRDLTEDEIAALRRATAARVAARQAVEAQEEAERRRQRAIEEDLRRWERMVDQAADYGAGRIADQFFSRTRQGWKELLSGMAEDFVRTLIHMAAQAALRPVIVTVGQAMGLAPAGAGGGVAGMAGGGGQGGALQYGSGFGSLLQSGGASGTLYGVGQWIATSSLGQGLGLSTTAGAPIALNNFAGNVAGQATPIMTGMGSSFASGLSYSPWGIVGSLGMNLLGFQGSGKPLLDFGLQTGGAVLGAWGGAALGASMAAGGAAAGAAAGAGSGAAAGAAAGSWLGPIGAVVGAALGVLLGGLFRDEDIPWARANGMVDTTGKYSLLLTQELDGGPVGEMMQANSQIAAAIGSLAKAMGADITRNIMVNSVAGRWAGRYQLESSVGTWTDANPETAAVGMLRQLILKGFVSGGLIGDDVMKIVQRNSFTDKDAFTSALDFGVKMQEARRALDGMGVSLEALQASAQAAVLEGLGPLQQELQQASKLKMGPEYRDLLTQRFRKELGLLEPTEPAEAFSQSEQALAAIRGRAEGLKQLIASLGLAIGAAEIAAAEAKAVQQLRDGFDRTVADQILALTDPTALQLRELETAHAARLKEAQDLGADLVEVERLNGLERLRLVQGQASQLKDWLDGQLLGQTSSLSPEGRLGAAQAQFAAAIAAARGGDAAAQGRVTQLADAVLAAAREMHASSVAFAGIEQLTRAQVAALGQALHLPGFAAGTLSAPPGMAWVGERGPELVRFRGGEQVYPAARSAAMAGGDSREMAAILLEMAAELRALRQLAGGQGETMERLDRRLNLFLAKVAA